LSHCYWNIAPPVEITPEERAGGKYSPLLIQLLHNRGVKRVEDFAAFLSSDSSLLGDPLLLTGMRKAMDRINLALRRGEKAAIYGDFDADGITSTAVLVQGLGILGIKAVPYIPHRDTEGHGLTVTVLEKLKEEGAGLVITVDCGVTDVAETKEAMGKGLDIIITDHHSPLAQIPDAIAVINPKLKGSKYPYDNLAGVGVAYKLLQALFKEHGKEDQLFKVTDLVAIGTVADMSPPLGENRYLIKEGLKNINASPRLGIKELIKQTRLEAGKIDAEKIGWVIAPCLNAAGRLADGLLGYKLLMTGDPKEAQELASQLTGKNEERQKLTSSTLVKAKEQVIGLGLQPLLITADREYPMGIAGLVASRLTEEFYRPSIVIHVAEDVCHASCRSIPEFDIIAALNKYSKYFSRYGGHAAAAGFTMPTKDLPKLEQELSFFAAEKLTGVTLRPHLDIDMEVKLNQLGGDTYATTQMLAPYGIGNPVPVFMSKGVDLIDHRVMGTGGEHLRMKLRQAGAVFDAVAFRFANHIGEFAPRIDVVYNLEIDTWQGRNNLRLNVLDFKKAVS
jgi:single-stranded-DNA-specific exonuclease